MGLTPPRRTKPGGVTPSWSGSDEPRFYCFRVEVSEVTEVNLLILDLNRLKTTAVG